MKELRKAVRLSGKDLFIYYRKDIEKIIVRGCTNKRVLAKKTGIEYNTLMKVFTRNHGCFYESNGVVIIKIHPGDIEKGGQSIARKGIGGMEKFSRYINHKTY